MTTSDSLRHTGCAQVIHIALLFTRDSEHPQIWYLLQAPKGPLCSLRCVFDNDIRANACERFLTVLAPLGTVSIPAAVAIAPERKQASVPGRPEPQGSLD